MSDAERTARLDRLRQRVEDAALDAVLVTTDESIAYLTGFRPMQFERFFAVAVTRDGGSVIVPRRPVRGWPGLRDRRPDLGQLV